MRLLDLFCGAGGASMGYFRAGFDVVGVDINPQPNYPFEFHQADALTFPLDGFDAVHASPPCQAFSKQTSDRSKHFNLIPATRQRLLDARARYVIENVEGTLPHLINPIRLCGSSFGLDVRRHRYFEANWDLVGKPCEHAWQTPRFRSLNIANVRAGRLASVVGVHGHINYPGEQELRERAMGIGWMSISELTQAIPPAYTEFIGRQMLNHMA